MPLDRSLTAQPSRASATREPGSRPLSWERRVVGRTRRMLAAALVTASVLVPAACAGAPNPHRAAIVVSASGRIGKLRIGLSDARTVVAFAGRPDADRRGSEFGSARYWALGYGCSHGSSGKTWPLLPKGPYCRTVFWINARTGKLGDFYTTSPRYAESHGVRIGMPTAVAEHILHRRVYVGCEENLAIGLLTVAFEGGVGRTTSVSSGLRLVGGHVYGFAVHGGRSDVGVFDCL